MGPWAAKALPGPVVCSKRPGDTSPAKEVSSRLPRRAVGPDPDFLPCRAGHSRVKCTKAIKFDCFFPGSHTPSNPGSYGMAEEVAEKVSAWTESSPQWLKPHSFQSNYGRAEARPLQRIRVFPQPVKPCPSFRSLGPRSSHRGGSSILSLVFYQEP